MLNTKYTLTEIQSLLVGHSDLEIVSTFLMQDYMYAEACDMLYKLMKGKANELTQWRDMVLGKQGMFDPIYYFQEYPEEIANRFCKLTEKVIHTEPFSEDDINWIKTNVPKLKLETIFWRDLYEKIEELGIDFGDGKEERK